MLKSDGAHDHHEDGCRELLKEYVRRNVDFADAELEAFCEPFSRRTVARNAFLLKAGQVCRFEGFVTRGCFRLYAVDPRGREKVLYFAGPDWWVTDIDSFTNQVPAQLSIQALEGSELLVISKTDKERLYAEMPKVEKLFRIMGQKTLVALQRRLIGTHSLTAEERYLLFFSTYPEIARRLTNVHIASYLGVTPEFVSKIRRILATRR